MSARSHLSTYLCGVVKAGEAIVNVKFIPLDALILASLPYGGRRQARLNNSRTADRRIVVCAEL
jgi:hypothetical protein